jgi:serine/threonine-protein kinase
MGELEAAEQGTGALRGYQLEEQVGAGAYGIVYRAHQPSVGRDVAIKVILPRYANDPRFIRRFEVEARLVAQLEHPSIVPLFDFWREPDNAYLVMRWMRGGSLKESLTQGNWDAESAAQLVNQIAAALNAAHQQGIVHQNLKPSNILLDEEGNAYLSGFGIATELSHAPAETSTVGLRGTPP